MPSEQDLRGPRRQAILSILNRGRVESQADLVERLLKKGYDVTQSSISRDLRELGVAKVGGRYVAPERDEQEAIARLGDVARFVRDVTAAGSHLTVVNTTIGAAPSVGLGIDRARWPEVIGTIAGDDTIFIATAGAREQRQLVHRLKRVMKEAR